MAEEKEEVQKKRLSLIQTKKDKQTQLKDIEAKMDRIEIVSLINFKRSSNRLILNKILLT